MKNFMLGLILFLGMVFLQKYIPKDNTPHIPQKYKSLVHFSQGAGY